MSNTLFVRGLRLEGGGNKILLYTEVLDRAEDVYKQLAQLGL